MCPFHNLNRNFHYNKIDCQGFGAVNLRFSSLFSFYKCLTVVELYTHTHTHSHCKLNNDVFFFLPLHYRTFQFNPNWFYQLQIKSHNGNRGHRHMIRIDRNQFILVYILCHETNSSNIHRWRRIFFSLILLRIFCVMKNMMICLSIMKATLGNGNYLLVW